VLNFITPHQKWGIHSTYTDNLLMLTLNRGGPVVWVSEVDAKRAGIVDNDWVEVFNANGALTARAVVSQRMKEGTVFMYHAQEKIVNTPGSEITGKRGGIHNSVTRTVLKPTHMIGGYAQLAYGFNYYGTVGSNRDEFVIVRKMARSTGWRTPRARRRPQNENPRSDRDGAEPRQVHRVSHLLGHLQERLDQSRRRRIRLVQQRRDQAGHRLSEGLGEPEALERRLARKPTARSSRAWDPSGASSPRSSPTPTCPRSTTTTSRSTSTTPTCKRARRSKAFPTARPRSKITGERMEKIEWGPNWEEILGGEFAKRSKDSNFEGVQKEIYGQFENTFMMYLPRLCEHCLNPTCVAACPSGAIYKREEDGIVLIDQDKCRGWRMCVSGCPYKKIYYNWERQIREVHLLLSAHRSGPADGLLGDLRRPHPLSRRLLYDADRIERRRQRPTRRISTRPSWKVFLDPNDPR
jgi:ferredoxin